MSNHVILKDKNAKILLCYMGIFFLTWTVYAFFIAPSLKQQHSLLYSLDVFKLLIWVLPVFIYLKHIKEDAFIYLKLKGQTCDVIKWTVFVSLILIIYQFVGRLITFQAINFNLLFDLDKWIKGVILVGFTEEILFRGFFLGEIAKYVTFGYANIITSILFLLVHFPGWIAVNHFPPGIFLKICLFAFIFIFSIIEGYVLKKTGSIWSCIAIHSINNFVSFSLGA